jgi:hypothetical protein
VRIEGDIKCLALNYVRVTDSIPLLDDKLRQSAPMCVRSPLRQHPDGHSGGRAASSALYFDSATEQHVNALAPHRAPAPCKAMCLSSPREPAPLATARIREEDHLTQASARPQAARATLATNQDHGP